jgi:hypothetical protein
MGRKKSIGLVTFVAMAGILSMDSATLHAQNFGWGFQRKHISLVRKLPPTGRIDGNSFSVNVAGAGSDVTSDLEAQITSLLVKNDGRLRSISDPKERPDAVIKARVTEYQQPQMQVKTEQGLELGKKGGPLQNQQAHEWIGALSVSFEAQDLHGNKGIAADTVTSKFDREYAVQTPTNAKPTFGSILGSHIPKVPLVGGAAGGGEDREPTFQGVREFLIKDVAMQIASRLVNTQETVNVFLARGSGLEEADTLLENQQYTRALENLDTMTPLGKPDDDAYRLYDLGVANEALGYQAEDVNKARKYLQEASIDYGKAIDAKPAEKMFLEPQNRIDTALAHYKVLSDEVNQRNAKAAAAAPAADVLTNADVISMVQAKLDQANIIDTIQHSSAKFDVSAKGQVDLAKAGVAGPIITAMKTKARGQ